jgi:hypothetical protein
MVSLAICVSNAPRRGKTTGLVPRPFKKGYSLRVALPVFTKITAKFPK